MALLKGCYYVVLQHKIFRRLRTVCTYLGGLCRHVKALCLLFHRYSELACSLGYRKLQLQYTEGWSAASSAPSLVPGSAIAHASLAVVDASCLSDTCLLLRAGVGYHYQGDRIDPLLLEIGVAQLVASSSRQLWNGMLVHLGLPRFSMKSAYGSC